MDMGCLNPQCMEELPVRACSPDASEGSSSSLSKNGKIKQRSNQSHKKKPTNRKSPPLNWFPRKKIPSYLERKIQMLQEVDGMNSTLDEALSESNPHYSKILLEKMAATEAANKAIEARKAAMVEASWCRILKAARIQSQDAESSIETLERIASEALDTASAMGVVLSDKRTCPKKASTSSPHAVTASFETAFEVDKEVAFAVKRAMVKLGFQDALAGIVDISTGDSAKQPTEEATKFNVVETIENRVQSLNEEEVRSLAYVVATCGLSASLAKEENVQTDMGRDLGSVLVKHKSKLEREVEEAKRKATEGSDLPYCKRKDSAFNEEGLEKCLVKRVSRLEKEIQEAKSKRNVAENDAVKEDKRMADVEGGGLGEILVKRKTKLEMEKEKMGKENDWGRRGHVSRNENNVLKDANADVEGLGEILVKRKTKLEMDKEKMGKGNEGLDWGRRRHVSHVKGGDADVERGGLGDILVKRDRKLEKLGKENDGFDFRRRGHVSRNERVLKEDWGGLGLDSVQKPHLSKLEREKAAWIKAEEEERKGKLKP